MKTWRWIYGNIIAFLTFVMIGLYIRDFLNDQEMKIADIIVWIIIIFVWFQFATWKNDSKAKNDEMGKQIRNKSAKISYYILMFALFFFGVQINYSTNHKKNLGIHFCLRECVYPLLFIPLFNILLQNGIQSR